MHKFLTGAHLWALLAVMLACCGSAGAQAPQPVSVPCRPDPIQPPAGQSFFNLKRQVGDSSPWTFALVPASGDVNIKVRSWRFNGQDPQSAAFGEESWGSFTGGGESSSFSWLSAPRAGTFSVTVKFIRWCGTGGGGTPPEETLEWGGKVEGQVSISFTQSTLAIGSKDDAAHQAKFKVAVKDDDGNGLPNIEVPTPEIVEGGLGPYEAVTASVSMDGSVTDSNGEVTGTLTSGHRYQSTKIQIKTDPDDPDSGGPSASAEQVWNSLGDDAWSYEPYFDYDESSDIEYRMVYNRDGAEVPITGHSMEPETTAISGYEWDYDAGEDWDEDGFPDGDYFYETYSQDDVDSSGYDAWEYLVGWGGVSESNGTYTVPQTIKYHEDFEIDTVYFWLWDNDSFGKYGDAE